MISMSATVFQVGIWGVRRFQENRVRQFMQIVSMETICMQ